jgi:CAAX protease family protein
MTTSVSGRQLGLALGAWIVASIIIGGSTALAWRLEAERGADSQALIAGIVFEVYALLIAALYVVVASQKGPASLGLRSAPMTAVVLAFGVGALAWVVVAVAYLAIGSFAVLPQALKWIGSDGGRLGALGPIATTLSVVRACILAPIGEELLFRGALFSWLRSRFRAWPAIIVTAVLFGVIHFMPLAIMPIAFALGLSLGWVRERTDSALPGIVFHVAQNVVIMVGAYAVWG